MECLQLLDLFLKDPDVIHTGHDSVRCHWRHVQDGSRQKRSHVERHGALGSVQDEQLAPAESEKGDLVGDLQVGEKRDVSGPFDSAEQQPRRQFANVLDAHDIVGLHALSIAGSRVGLGSQQHGDEA